MDFGTFMLFLMVAWLHTVMHVVLGRMPRSRVGAEIQPHALLTEPWGLTQSCLLLEERTQRCHLFTKHKVTKFAHRGRLFLIQAKVVYRLVIALPGGEDKISH